MGKYLGGNARFEPFLQNIAEGRIKNGFINRTPKGRVVTELTYQHLGISYKEA